MYIQRLLSNSPCLNYVPIHKPDVNVALKSPQGQKVKVWFVDLLECIKCVLCSWCNSGLQTYFMGLWFKCLNRVHIFFFVFCGSKALDLSHHFEVIRCFVIKRASCCLHLVFNSQYEWVCANWRLKNKSYNSLIPGYLTKCSVSYNLPDTMDETSFNHQMYLIFNDFI